MPKIVEVYGYKIYFYSNEGDEPCHVHVTKDHKTDSKIWIEPEIKIAHNDAKISKKNLKNILDWLDAHKDDILTAWNNFFSK